MDMDGHLTFQKEEITDGQHRVPAGEGGEEAHEPGGHIHEWVYP